MTAFSRVSKMMIIQTIFLKVCSALREFFQLLFLHKIYLRKNYLGICMKNLEQYLSASWASYRFFFYLPSRAVRRKPRENSFGRDRKLSLRMKGWTANEEGRRSDTRFPNLEALSIPPLRLFWTSRKYRSSSLFTPTQAIDSSSQTLYLKIA